MLSKVWTAVPYSASFGSSRRACLGGTPSTKRLQSHLSGFACPSVGQCTSWFLDQLCVSLLLSFLLWAPSVSLALPPPLPQSSLRPPFCFSFARRKQALCTHRLKVVFSLLYFSIWARDRHFFAPLQQLAIFMEPCSFSERRQLR